MLLGNWTAMVGTPAVYPVPFDVRGDFVPVALLSSSPLMMIGRKSLPADNVKELIAWLKANPGKATAGTIGVGSPSQVGAIYFQKLTGTQIRLVPYRGAAPALTDLLAGQIDLRMGAEASQTLPYVKSGAVKPFAIMGKTRWAAAPDIPTIEQAGVPELALSFWQAFWVPKATPPDIVAKLNAAGAAGVLDDQRLAERRLHRLRQEPRQRIDRPTGGKRHDDDDRPGRIIERRGTTRERRQHGGSARDLQQSPARQCHGAPGPRNVSSLAVRSIGGETSPASP